MYLYRLTGIVDDLLLLSRLGERESNPAVTDLSGLAIEAAERWSRDAEKRGIEPDARHPPGGFSCWCPPRDAEHVLDALIENALLYGGEEITLRAGPDRRIEVLDRGRGVAREEQERIFERFHRGNQGRRVEGGTGLGLSIARGLASAWGGDVDGRESRRRGGNSRDRYVPASTVRRRLGTAGALMARGTLVTIGLGALAGIAIAVGPRVAAAYLTTPSVGISR